MLRSLLIFILITLQTSYSQVDNIWLPTSGPQGSIIINDLQSYKNNLFAATGNNGLSGAVFMLDNNKWQYMSNGIPTETVVLSLYEFNGNLLAGTTNKGVFRFTGFTWEEFNNGLKENGSVNVSRISKFVSTGNDLFFASINGVFKLFENEWINISNEENLFSRVDAIYLRNDSLYVGAINSNSNNSSIFIYDLENQNWIENNENLIIQDGIFTHITFHNNQYYAFGINSTNVSIDGITWNSIESPGSIVYDSFIINNELYIVTRQNGIQKVNEDSYSIVIEQDELFFTNHCVELFEDKIYYGRSFRGVYSSNIDFTDFIEFNNGLVNLGITALASNEDYIFATENQSDYGFVWRSSDKGDSWERLSEGLLRLGYNSISVEGQLVVAGGSGTGISISTNNGDSWFTADSLSNAYVNAILVNNSRIIAGTSGFGQGSFLSDNKGNFWRAIDDLPKTDLISITAQNEILYASLQGAGIFRSTNNGDSWQEFNNGLEAEPGSIFINEIHANNDLVLAVSGFNIFKLNGNSWEKKFTTSNFGSMKSIYFDDGICFCMTRNGMIYSFDEGESWSNAAFGFFRDYPVNSFDSDADYYYLGSNGLSVWRLSKRATSIFFNEKIEELKVYPNPVINEMNIENHINLERLEIIDFEGKVIISYDRAFERIDLSNLVMGVYFIRGYKNDKVFGSIIIKN